ncbi:hypothetical protein XELAEV_18045721mg [Xenopus laevis]|uniref:G-protein coupled receptors family 1 profile domain-containing protein n=1 Tax=Xenopus laevis TaxID=8355 RepID=A0A974H4I8_XENLA|nr:hypothetical protein XELAEV_18045721mg [Xenopus laevis]
MVNETVLSEFILSGLSDLEGLQLPLFLFFLFIYLMTVISNSVILLLVCKDSHLKTPMYFVLGCLACLDMCCSSVTAPRMPYDIHTKRRVISMAACITQLFFFIYFAICEMFLLAVMSYDRSNIVENFFCDLPQLFQLSCTDISINMLVILLLGVFLGVGSLAMTFLPYIRIFATVLNIQEKNMKQKAFSTCITHLAVVFIFYGTLLFNYFRPATNYNFTQGRLVSVFYTVFMPLLNPYVYSLRNQEFKTALRRTLKCLRILNKNICSSSS